MGVFGTKNEIIAKLDTISAHKVSTEIKYRLTLATTFFPRPNIIFRDNF